MRTLVVALAAALLSLSGTGRAETLYFIHVDHLGTPRLAVGEDGVERWRWDNIEPFGDNPPIEVMGPEGYLVNLPLRFPGQYHDKETNLHYNMARDFDSGIGRYIQADPLGVATTGGPIPTTGLNHLYVYVTNNPLSYTDPTGLYKYADDGVGRVTNPEMDKFLLCLDACTEMEQTLTSTTDGKHEDPGHAAGTSVDIRPTGTPSKKLFCCAGTCGSIYVLDERVSRTKFWNGPHYHVQLRAPSNPQRNAIPPGCRPGGC